jgi:uncharacterized protein YggE
MKRTKLFTAIFAIMLAGAIFAQPLQATATEPSTIAVSGTGAVSLPPDIATVNLGVSTQDANPQRALVENNRLTEIVIATLLGLDIDEDDIRTAHFFIDPVFGPDWIAITGYRVTNSISVTIRDIDQVGEILGAAVAAGANVSHGVNFGISDSSEAYEQALALAIQDAQRRARAIAAALDAQIIARVSVVEMGGMHTPVARQLAGAVVAEAQAMDWGAVPIEAGELTVTANVQIVFSVTQ